MTFPVVGRYYVDARNFDLEVFATVAYTVVYAYPDIGMLRARTAVRSCSVVMIEDP